MHGFPPSQTEKYLLNKNSYYLLKTWERGTFCCIMEEFDLWAQKRMFHRRARWCQSSTNALLGWVDENRYRWTSYPGESSSCQDDHSALNVDPAKDMSIQKLWVWPYLEKGSLWMKLGISRWDLPGLLEWALNPMVSILIRKREDAHRGKGSVKMGQRLEWCKTWTAGTARGRPETGREGGVILLQSLQKAPLLLAAFF